MIFVTVGTHEQSFNRLIEYIDALKKEGEIKDNVIIQKGYSTYIPEYCQCYDFLPYKLMNKYVKEADIVITHGGPATFLMPLRYNKIPIVVPRQKKFNEHINNHQVEFVKFLEKKSNNIIPIYDIDKLKKVIQNYNFIIENMSNIEQSNTNDFNEKFNEVINELFK